MKKPDGTRIQQLCSLGLSENHIMPALLELLHDYIPSYANVYMWADAQGNVAEIYDERPISHSLMALYYDEFMNSLEMEVFDGWPSSLIHRNAVDMDLLWKVDRKTFFRHSFYNELYGQVGYHWGLHRPIRSNSRNHGALQLHRTHHDRPFSQDDAVNLDKVARHLEYAFRIPQESYENCTKLPSNTGFITANSKGKILNYSRGAERLTLLALTADLNQKHGSILSIAQSPHLTELTSRLDSITGGQDVEPPSVVITNKWGKFCVMAYLMYPTSAANGKQLINFKIEHFLPPQLLLLERLDDYKLTQRQKEICIQIGLNHSYEDIATRLGIAKSTVISHKKDVFNRLGINNRNELVDHVLYRH